jgi:hypothetical protein
METAFAIVALAALIMLVVIAMHHALKLMPVTHDEVPDPHPITPKPERARGPDGRFVKKDKAQ